MIMLWAGVDVGSLQTPAYVAWLTGSGLLCFDGYVPDVRHPLPVPPAGWARPTAVALDAPQDLPAGGRDRRAADAAAGTPTGRMPAGRLQLQQQSLYRELIAAGVDLFWAVYIRGSGRVPGLAAMAPARGSLVLETYPRKVLRKLLPSGIPLPSKRKQTARYIDLAWTVVRRQGCWAPGVVRPTVDQVDAALCALAARGAGSWRWLGLPPRPDCREQGLREGYILAPW
ncbi:MAG: DUF429 domain-containing protein [Firmicutes bacterium]|nr:DUF429 domain-containing protein [Bacillota bacterium]